MLKEADTTALSSQCEQCFGLCCVALPYIKSSDFPNDKDSGVPCQHLRADYQCATHDTLRENGFKGCTVYECFGAGQKISQLTYEGVDWRTGDASHREEMFDAFPVMQQLHEMLYYLNEARMREEVVSIHPQLSDMYEKTEKLTLLSGKQLLQIDIPLHRHEVNQWLTEASRLVRQSSPPAKKTCQKPKKKKQGLDLLGANLQRADLRGESLRGAWLMAANLQGADLRCADVIGADFRDANISGADLTSTLFLTQAQVNACHGDHKAKLPSNLSTPRHWQ